MCQVSSATRLCNPRRIFPQAMQPGDGWHYHDWNGRNPTPCQKTSALPPRPAWCHRHWAANSGRHLRQKPFAARDTSEPEAWCRATDSHEACRDRRCGNRRQPHPCASARPECSGSSCSRNCRRATLWSRHRAV